MEVRTANTAGTGNTVARAGAGEMRDSRDAHHPGHREIGILWPRQQAAMRLGAEWAQRGKTG
jgi:hypothetical protein